MLLTTQSLLHLIFQFLIWNNLKRTVEKQEFYMKILYLEKTGTKNGKFVEMREKTCKARWGTDLEDTMILGSIMTL